jgi:protein ImuB
MSLSEASALAPLEIRTHDPNEDLDQLCHLTELAQQFSPIVGLEQLDKKPWAGRNLLQPECILIDVTGLASFFGGEEQLLGLVSKWLFDQGYFGCMAIASSLGAAWAIANYGNRKRSSSTTPQSDALENQSTNSELTNSELTNPQLTNATLESQFMIAASGDNAATLARMPIAALRLAPDTVQTLQRLGIHFIGQLEQLPRAGMATRLGQTLLDRWDQALGNKPEPLIALHTLPEWQLEQTLEYPTEHRATIAELIRRLSRDLACRLAARGEGAMRIVCRLDQVESSPLVMQLSLFRPTADAEHLQTLLVGQLEQQLGSHASAAVWRLSIQATLTAPLVWHQTDLFDGDAIENRHQLARLVDNLSNRLGRKQVLRARLEREPQPENACTLQPMTGRRPDGSEQATVKKISSRLARHRAEPTVEDPMRRPTRLLSPPTAIEVIALADGLPTQFKVHQQPHTVVQYWGPERLESGWWRGPSVRRDYYRVETEHGVWWWIYRDMQTNDFFLHGVFD